MQEFAEYSGKRVLVTGGAGYIGSVLISKLVPLGCEITTVLMPGDPLPFQETHMERIKTFEGDVRDAGAWEGWLEGQDIVFHLAGQTSHYIANEHPIHDWQANAAPILHLCGACQRQEWNPRILFASTATVYGAPDQLPVDESFPQFPLTIYDVNKLAAEGYLAYFSMEHGIPSVTLRLSNVYGPSIGTSKKERGVMNQMALKALEGEALQVYGTGVWRRDYIHLDDVVAAFMLAAIATEDKVAGRAFNVSTGVGTNFVDAVNMIAEAAEQLTNFPVLISHVDAATLSVVDERNYIGNYGAFMEATSWSPKIDVASGLKNLVKTLFESG